MVLYDRVVVFSEKQEVEEQLDYDENVCFLLHNASKSLGSWWLISYFLEAQPLPGICSALAALLIQ